jgi:hypothetical protein
MVEDSTPVLAALAHPANDDPFFRRLDPAQLADSRNDRPRTPPGNALARVATDDGVEVDRQGVCLAAALVWWI